MLELRMLIERMMIANRPNASTPVSIVTIEYGSIINRLDQLYAEKKSGPMAEREYLNLMMEAHSLLNNCENENEKRLVQNLINRISRQQNDLFRLKNATR